ncbi:tumor necrosis factor, alpha-induced protein 3 [Plakobranchus ocellatus]|uniref:Tumor necrosis factor, alpha-induced protein 3 n=1 Tax=Plakobranchus ocellatus TaxID=259542 RepID=A0AAV4A890_9GAST|nr:tumor necrosis factor, alpha-induced protein 3 [Plakobranchus ocellatus]
MHPRFQQLYTDAVLDKIVKDDLEKCGTLNWCRHTTCVMLEAVAVPKDGNCLLHAASFAIWSVDDQQHILREVLLLVMLKSKTDSFKHRWWHQKLRDLKLLADDSKIIKTEWNEVVRSISSLTTTGETRATPCTFLESVHIYVLANILRRPIVIVSDTATKHTKGQRVEDNHIAGIYLPLEWPPIKCCKTPLILGFSQGHFCPLLSEAALRPTTHEPLFPLMTKDFSSLNVRFLSQAEEHKASELIQSYFRIKELNIAAGDGGEVLVPCAVLKYKPLPSELDTVSEHFKFCEQLAYQSASQGSKLDETTLLHQMQMKSQTKVAPMRSFSESYEISMRNQALKGNSAVRRGLSAEELEQRVVLATQTQRCISKGCSGQGNPAQGNFCDTCFKNYTIAEAGAELVSINTGEQRMFVLHDDSANANRNPKLFAVGGREIEPEPLYIQPSAPPAQSLAYGGQPQSLLNGLHGNIANAVQNPKFAVEGREIEPEPLHIQPSAPPAQSLAYNGQPQSLLNARCSCGYRCSQQTYPFCHECFDAMQKKNAISKPPGDDVSGMMSFLGPAAVGVNDVNNPQGNLMLFSPSPLPTATNPLAFVAPNVTAQAAAPNALKSSSDLELQVSPSQQRPQNGLADELHQTLQLNAAVAPKALAEPVHSQQLAMPEQSQAGVGDDDLIEVSEGRESCVSPYCMNLVLFPSKLCEKCQDVLKASHKQHTQHPSKQVPTQALPRASAAGKVQTLNQIQTHKSKTQNMGRNYEPQGLQNHEPQGLQNHLLQARQHHKPEMPQHSEIKDKPRGKPCITPTCENYGDPANSYMCSSCYMRALHEYEHIKRRHDKARAQDTHVRHLAQSPARKNWTEPIPVSNEMNMSSFVSSHTYYPRRNPELGPQSELVTNKSSVNPNSRNSMHSSLENFPTSDIHHFNQGFEKAYDRFSGETKAGLKTCKTIGCVNYGNPTKGGFCNSCNAVREKDRIAIYGETVPDCHSGWQNSI